MQWPMDISEFLGKKVEQPNSTMQTINIQAPFFRDSISKSRERV